MENPKRITAALDAISCAACDRDTWLRVGMALKYEGFDVSTWDQWSRTDTDRYRDGECERLWKGFKNNVAKPVTGGSIIQLGIDNNMKWDYGDSGAQGWDDVIDIDDDRPDTFSGAKQLAIYLKTLFKPSEIVGYVTKANVDKSDGRITPTKGVYTRTCGELIAALEKYDDIGAALGDWSPDGGAWIRFNPLDGLGVGNDNVTRLSYALVECDTLSPLEQEKAYKQINLPVAAMVYSGKKSVHAVVRVDARNAEEYTERVKKLYDILSENGIPIDKQNKNPSRLSRMPGVTRGGKMQNLICYNIGCSSWDTWIEYIEDAQDPLPDFISLDKVFYNPPPLPDEMIFGVLRRGHKMIISSDSKAGKSFLLIELGIAIAEGCNWIEHFKCAQGRVLYVNLEIDEPSFDHRVIEAYRALQIQPKNLQNFVMWHLRGHSETLDVLATRIQRRIQTGEFDVVIIDPIYKVLMGDENKASDMSAFCNQFDRICNFSGASVIYCHHHSKGSQAGKKTQDRASGSGVFARDPDAILDVTQVEVPEDENGCKPFMDMYGTDGATLWEMTCSLREFRDFKPFRFWFKYPIHVALSEEEETASKDFKLAGDTRNNLKNQGKSDESRLEELDAAFNELATYGTAAVSAIADSTGRDVKTIKNWVEHRFSNKYAISNGNVVKKV